MKLTDSKVRKAPAKKEPYKLTDGNGLHLQVTPTGAKLWRYRYRINGRENLFAIGEYSPPEDGETAEQKAERLKANRFTLEEARQQRQDARGIVKQGKHPRDARNTLIAQRIAEGTNTFESVARQWMASKVKWTTRHRDQVKRVLETEVFSDIGTLPIRSEQSVFVPAIRTIMKKVAQHAPVTAINIRQWCHAVFCHAVAKGYADIDPTIALEGLIERPEIKHKTPLTVDGISQLVTNLDKSGFFQPTRIALRLLLILFVRPSELRKAEWSEFDLKRAEWTIPAARMKKRELHVVPLPIQAVALLGELHGMTGQRKYLFPNHRRPDECMSDTTLNQALNRLGYENKFSAHGFRATATTLLHKLGKPEHLIELSLAHKERNNTKAAYNQYQYYEERRALMQEWADYIDSLSRGDNVIPINRAAYPPTCARVCP